MREHGDVKHEADGRNAPEPDVEVPPPVHRCERDIAKRMIEEMGENVAEHHKAAGEPHLPNANAAQRGHEPRRAASLRCARVVDGRNLSRHA